MYYKEYSSIEQTATAWDNFLPSNHHLKSETLIIPEVSKLENISFSYLLIYNNSSQIIAVAYFQKIHFGRKHYISIFEQNAFIKPIENLITKKGFQLLVCGNLLRIDSSGLFYDKLTTDTLSIFNLLESFYKSLKPSPHVILIKDWESMQHEDWITKLKYKIWEGDLTMKFKVDPLWNSFEDYIKSLRHRYAQRVRKSRNLLSTVTRKELSLLEIVKYSDEIEQLYNNVVYKQSIRMVIVPKFYFIEMKKSLHENFRIHLYFLDNIPVGFTSQIINDQLLEIHFIGLDYKINQSHWLYFNMLYDSIQDAISLKKNEVELGRTAREAKANIGAYPVFFNNYYRVNGYFTSLMVELLNKSFTSKNKQILPKKEVSKLATTSTETTGSFRN